MLGKQLDSLLILSSSWAPLREQPVKSEATSKPDRVTRKHFSDFIMKVEHSVHRQDMFPAHDPISLFGCYIA